MAESLDKQIAVADAYAEALFALAQEKQCVAIVRHELEELVSLEQIEPSFAAFMSSAALDDDHRAAGLEKMFRGRISDEVLNTLLVMNERGRFGLTAALLRSFVIRHEAAEGQIEGTVTSAVELSDDLRKQAERTAAEISGKKPLLKFQVDPAILGGLVVQIGDWRYDNSVLRHLTAARRRLYERGQHGLPVGTA